MFTRYFDDEAIPGQYIETVVKGFTCRATIYRDEDSGPPDSFDEGFWPSTDPDNPGYVPPESYEAQRKAAQRAMRAWERDEWFYVGVAVTVYRCDIQLTKKYAHALWGIECNYPLQAPRKNAYLTQAANDLLEDAIEDAESVLQALKAS